MASAPSLSMDDMPDRAGANTPATGIVGAPPAQNSSPMPDQQQQSRGFVMQVKNIHTNIEDLARQFSAGSSEFKKAQDALKEAMVKVLSEMQKSEQGGQQPMAA
jgi:hypothetical protein